MEVLTIILMASVALKPFPLPACATAVGLAASCGPHGFSLLTAHLQNSVTGTAAERMATGGLWCCRKNGKHLGTAFRKIANVPLFPTIGLHR